MAVLNVLVTHYQIMMIQIVYVMQDIQNQVLHAFLLVHLMLYLMIKDSVYVQVVKYSVLVNV
jgi:hypothetical protein